MYADRLLLAETLIMVLETGSFTLAAEKLGISQSTVSRRIAALEVKLGGKPLFHRGTRTINPSENVRSYIKDIQDVLARLDAADAKIHQQDREPTGILRVSIPPSLGRAKLLHPLANLNRAYPKLRIRIDLSEHYIDLRERAFDLVVRIKPTAQTGVDQIKLGESNMRFVGTPSYFKTRTRPGKLSELKNHAIIGRNAQDEDGTLSIGGKRLNIAHNLRPAISASDITAIYELVRADHGISLLPDYLIIDDLAAGLLVRCVSDFAVPPLEIFALHLRDQRNTPNIKAALETLSQAMA